MKKLRKQSLDGKVETFLMAILESGPSYGYGLVQELARRAQGLLRLGEGTIYPVLHRMEERDLIAANWRESGNGRPRKYYRLTPKGRRALAENRAEWRILSQVMDIVLKPAGIPDDDVAAQAEGGPL